jgi:glucosyl-3-phosphoglycerate synthase
MIKQYKHTDFLPLDKIVAQKEQKGHSVSLVIPALNEAATIGSIIAQAKHALMKEAGLVDEIIVMDGDSSDNTADIAAEQGAKVHKASEIFAGHSFPAGKGTALWKSLFVSSGDIIVCVDADITDFSPRFIYGVVAPLLCNEDTMFVKAFYRRWLEVGNAVLEHEGGRVTEILMRPVLDTFYPELSGLFQPLAGEYSFRRNVVEPISFFSGYGVEIGLILDIYAQWGISAFAQVDVDLRRHRNRPVKELGRMAFRIFQAVLKKLEEQNKISLHMPLGKEPACRAGIHEPHIFINEEMPLPPADNFKEEAL